jgi:CxxC-x17-CxxC domain-containing protein
MPFKKEGKKFGNKKPFSRDSRSSFSRDSRPPFADRSPARSFERKGGRSNGMEMFDAVCESCGKDCQLPFRPTGGKPVYCRNCFNNNQEGSKTSAPRRAESSDDLREINRKLDKIMRALKID